jgi:hypothetical protein
MVISFTTTNPEILFKYALGPPVKDLACRPCKLNDIEPCWRPPSHLPSREAGCTSGGLVTSCHCTHGQVRTRPPPLRARASFAPTAVTVTRVGELSTGRRRHARSHGPASGQQGGMSRKAGHEQLHARARVATVAHPSRLTVSSMDEKSIRGRALRLLSSASLRSDNLCSSWCFW